MLFNRNVDILCKSTHTYHTCFQYITYVVVFHNYTNHVVFLSYEAFSPYPSLPIVYVRDVDDLPI